VTAARVLLLGGDPLARAGVAALLNGAAEVVVAGAGSTDEAPGLLLALDPEVLCWDPAGEVRSAPGLVAAAGRVPVLALVEAGEEAGDLWRAGVRALLPRRTGGEALAAGLRATAKGLTVLEPRQAAGWLRPPGPAAGEGPDALTPREQEVLALLAEGLGNKAIAARLEVSEHTSKFHVNAILGKLGAATRAEAIVLAARRGLVVL
jgi:two-component system nitrate/nitrite response regulator NarL